MEAIEFGEELRIGRRTSRTNCLPRSSLYSVFRLTAFLCVYAALDRTLAAVDKEMRIPKTLKALLQSSLKEVAGLPSEIAMSILSCSEVNRLFPNLGPLLGILMLPAARHLEIVLTLTSRISATSFLVLPLANSEEAKFLMVWSFMPPNYNSSHDVTGFDL